MAETELVLSAISGAKLMDLEFMPQEFVVRGLLPKGLSILGGAPKIGKSWLMLELALRKLLWQFTQEPPGVSVSVTNLILFGPENLAFAISPSYEIEQDGTRSCKLSGLGSFSLSSFYWCELVIGVCFCSPPFSGTTTQSYGTSKVFLNV